MNTAFRRCAMKPRFSQSTRPHHRRAVWAALALFGLMTSHTAHAVDGCKVLLCMAGNWQDIAPCEPTVRQALRDVARGRGWPECNAAGDSGCGNQFVAPEQCPEQYVTPAGLEDNGRPIYVCPFQGVVHVAIGGQPWSRTWWSPSGDSVVEWLPAARQALSGSPGAMDDRFERDHAAWVIDRQSRNHPDGVGDAAPASAP